MLSVDLAHQGFRKADVQYKLRPEIAMVRQKSRSKTCDKLPIIGSVRWELMSVMANLVKKSCPNVYIAHLFVT